LTPNESPCFEIDVITLDTKSLEDNGLGFEVGLDSSLNLSPRDALGFSSIKTKFQSYLNSSLSTLGFKPGMCLGEKSINSVVTAFNNEIVASGYITTTASLKPLNLKSKKLEFKPNVGTINSISINNNDNQRHRAMLFSAFGQINHNKPLNIRDIEQALENISNATFADVGISLSPSAMANSTNIIISRTSRYLPFSLYLSLDNAGSRETGRYQASTTLSGINLLGFNEIYTLSLGKAVLNNERTNLKDDSKKGSSHNHYINFTIPFGYYSLAYTNSRYSYDQIIAGVNNLYKYSGVSRVQSLNLSYLFYRDQSIKSSVFISLFKRDSKNYIEEFELKNQRRVTAGYEIGVKSQLNLNSSQINSSLSYKRGTGMLGAIRAPEENIAEGTSRMRIWLLDIGYKHKLSNSLSYDANLHAQYNKSKLTIQDRLSIGGIYSVRGFDGQMSLVGQKGLYLRNMLSYNYTLNHAIYLALDGGAVYDTTSQVHGSNKLAGAGVGIKGVFDIMGSNLSYDLLISRPLYKPEYFKSKDTHVGFRIGWRF
ncbi:MULTISPECIES: ShlB/FhaC/HecB family hemolysin secretion/activation protein, partial [unclassified Campylobacter]|uniref:ShlB/FhaC/HecB family hemolysin secretion/activation protein n=1 Tax=unclassified Campylobacter TaxID=2593542 RepID=UPI003D33F36E